MDKQLGGLVSVLDADGHVESTSEISEQYGIIVFTISLLALLCPGEAYFSSHRGQGSVKIRLSTPGGDSSNKLL